MFAFQSKTLRFIRALREASRQLYSLKEDQNMGAFIAHNQNVWAEGKQGVIDNAELLFEYNNKHSSIISYSYLANVLARKHKARIIPFRVERKETILRRLYAFITAKNEKLYKSFGATPVRTMIISRECATRAEKLFNDIYPTLRTKRDIEKITVNGLHVGDLLYDFYLRRYIAATIDLKNPDFISATKQFLALLVFWEEYFDTHNVKAIHVSHTVYQSGLLPRLAISRGIAAYQVHATNIFRVNKQYPNAYSGFLRYPEMFRSLPQNMRDKGMKTAAERIERRFSGEVGVDMHYSTRSAYSDKEFDRLLKPSGRKKVLIATHMFNDAPHAYGTGLFPDFYEWLTFLGNVSEKTDYDWYIKTHPDLPPGDGPIIQSLIDQFPKFRLLPSDASHHQLIKEGLDVALTVHGTIGFEYAALGMPVITASPVCPTAAYDFNIHPKNVEEYEEYLMNLGSISVSIDRDKICEYYFMHYIFGAGNWLFDDYEQMIDDLGGYQQQFTSRVYPYFLDQFSNGKHARIVRSVENFVNSGDFQFTVMHIPEK